MFYTISIEMNYFCTDKADTKESNCLFEKAYELVMESFRSSNFPAVYRIFQLLRQGDNDNILNHTFLLKRHIDLHNAAPENSVSILESLHVSMLDKVVDIYQTTTSNKKIHIFCDIDDTVLKVIHLDNHDFSMVLQGWRDIAYPFISQKLRDFVSDSSFSSGFVTFPTNRPVYLEDYTKRQIKESLPGIQFNILPADDFLFMHYALQAILLKNPRPFTKEWFDLYYFSGISKFNRIMKYMSVYPELVFAFIGDTGEGDFITASLLLFHSKIKNIYLHDIKAENGIGYLPPNSVHVFQNSHLWLKLEIPAKDHIVVSARSGSNSYHQRNIYLFDNFDPASVDEMFQSIKSF
jgi:hypothetical protein